MEQQKQSSGFKIKVQVREITRDQFDYSKGSCSYCTETEMGNNSLG